MGPITVLSLCNLSTKWSPVATFRHHVKFHEAHVKGPNPEQICLCTSISKQVVKSALPPGEIIRDVIADDNEEGKRGRCKTIGGQTQNPTSQNHQPENHSRNNQQRPPLQGKNCSSRKEQEEKQHHHYRENSILPRHCSAK